MVGNRCDGFNNGFGAAQAIQILKLGPTVCAVKGDISSPRLWVKYGLVI